jgi:hypothetical protein
MKESPHKITKEEAAALKAHYEKHGLFWIRPPKSEQK